jgi:DHA1 family inner membrane transport protein
LLQKASGGGQNLASSLNIAAFNLGNPISACLGGVLITHGPGIGAVTWVAALATVCGLMVVVLSVQLDRDHRRASQQTNATVAQA